MSPRKDRLYHVVTIFGCYLLRGFKCKLVKKTFEKTIDETVWVL